MESAEGGTLENPTRKQQTHHQQKHSASRYLDLRVIHVVDIYHVAIEDPGVVRFCELVCAHEGVFYARDHVDFLRFIAHVKLEFVDGVGCCY